MKTDKLINNALKENVPGELRAVYSGQIRDWVRQHGNGKVVKALKVDFQTCLLNLNEREERRDPIVRRAHRTRAGGASYEKAYAELIAFDLVEKRRGLYGDPRGVNSPESGFRNEPQFPDERGRMEILIVELSKARVAEGEEPDLRNHREAIYTAAMKVPALQDALKAARERLNRAVPGMPKSRLDELQDEFEQAQAASEAGLTTVNNLREELYTKFGVI